MTWDPEYYNKTIPLSNSTSEIEISLRLDYFNRTSENSSEGEMLKLDETDTVPASRGIFALKIKGEHLKGYRPHNVTITLMTNTRGSSAKNESTSVKVVMDKHRLPDPDLSGGPDHDDLVIALPVVFGSIILIAVGLFLWNRKTRRIQIGNIMSRSARKGYTGRSARDLLNRSGGRKDDGIPLQHREPIFEYRDDFDSHPAGAVGTDSRRHQRYDSDLGSLAGASPTTPGFGRATTHGGEGNAFREELRRQDDLRRNNR